MLDVDRLGCRTRRRLAVAAVALSLPLTLSAVALANDSALRLTLNSWSKTIGADAHAVALAAQQRHPRKMTSSGLLFRRDALRARTAIAAQKPSSARGHRAQTAALAAFADYATAGTGWAASGRARLAGHKAAAATAARRAAAIARNGNRLLVAAGKLLP